VGELIAEYEVAMGRPMKPVIVSSGPCQENVVKGDDVDLFSLPVPMVHEGDGGRYIGTWHINLAKDPDSDWVNWGMYRVMLTSEKVMAGLCLPTSDQGKIFYGKYVPKKRPMPFAMAIGADPVSSMVSMASFGVGVNEADYAGALLGQPVELVKAVTSDILVPAHAEIILEGELFHNAVAEEGPFGEYTGYRTAPRTNRSVYKVNVITFRNNPIFTMTCLGTPVDDCALGMAVIRSVDIKRFLVDNGVPVTSVFVPPEGAMMLGVVGIKAQYSNIAQQIGQLIFGAKFGGLWMSSLIVVDEDVDVFNISEVLHSLVTKCHPVKGITVLPRAIGSPLFPFLDVNDRILSKGCKAVYDCTWPIEWPKGDIPTKAAFSTMYPNDIQERVLSKWEEDCAV
jgi:4-hydroxy-3-polyprenylbenzoate decarboxylase